MRLTCLAVAATGGLAAIAAPSASAQIFASAGYTALKVDLGPAAGGDITLGALTGRVAVGVAPFVSLEGEVSTGVKDDDYSVQVAFGRATYTASLDNQIGAYVVGRVPVPTVGSIFGRVGYVNTSLGSNGTILDDGAGLAYGAGVELDVIPFIRGRLEYTKFDSIHAESLSASAAIKF